MASRDDRQRPTAAPQSTCTLVAMVDAMAARTSLRLVLYAITADTRSAPSPLTLMRIGVLCWRGCAEEGGARGGSLRLQASVDIPRILRLEVPDRRCN